MPFSPQNPNYEARSAGTTADKNPKQYQMTKACPERSRRMPIFKTKIRSSSGFAPPAFR
jgi:hypothetical protein